MEKEKLTDRAEKKSSKIYIPVFILIFATLAASGYWYWKYMKYITTDDAFIDCDNVALSSKIMGRIVALHVNEGDSVMRGQLLVELDSADLKAQKQQAEAMVRQMLTNVRQAEAKLNADKENIKVFEINMDKAKTDFDRSTAQKDADVITQEQYENFRKNHLTSVAQYHSALAQVEVSKVQVETAKAAVNNAYAQVNVIETQLKNTRIYCPFNGIVGKRWLIAGDMAQPGQTILAINDRGNLWVSVFLEETKLNDIHMGQKAEFTVDAYPGNVYAATVYYIGSNTAGRYSLIPPNNAAGNFTKITQRVQLKLTIDDSSNPVIKDARLFAGMSAVVKLIK
jgi:membrane fusion protein (multidrug efflux system)